MQINIKNSKIIAIICFAAGSLVAAGILVWKHTTCFQNNEDKVVIDQASKQAFYNKAKNTTDKIVIVNLKRILSEVKVGVGIEKQVIGINRSASQEITDLENKMKSMETNKRTEADVKKIEETQLMIYDVIRSKRLSIESGYKNALRALDTAVKQHIDRIAKEKSFPVVLDSDAIVTYTKEACCDITDDVIKSVDMSCDPIKIELK